MTLAASLADMRLFLLEGVGKSTTKWDPAPIIWLIIINRPLCASARLCARATLRLVLLFRNPFVATRWMSLPALSSSCSPARSMEQ